MNENLMKDPRVGEYDSRKDTLRHIQDVKVLLYDVISQLRGRAVEHDASKLESPEKEMFDRFTPLLREMAYDSPEYQAALAEMRETALPHHYAHNRHHPEFHEHGIHDMNLIDLIEMFCDWLAAGQRHDPPSDIAESIRKNRERFGYGDEIERLLLNTVGVITG